GRIVVGFLDLLSVAFFLFFARKPMLLFGVSGLALVGLGVLVGLVTIVLRVLHAMPPFGYRPLLYLVILLEMLGFLLFGFGFLAELTAQQHAELEALRRRLDRRDHDSGREESARPGICLSSAWTQPMIHGRRGWPIGKNCKKIHALASTSSS